MSLRALRLLAGIGLAAAIGCDAVQPAADSSPGADPTAAATRSFPTLLLSSNDGPAADWPLHGPTFAEDRFSPLDQIDDGNVAPLGLVWSYDTGTDRGLEATPIVVDGTMYTTWRSPSTCKPAARSRCPARATATASPTCVRRRSAATTGSRCPSTR